MRTRNFVLGLALVSSVLTGCAASGGDDGGVATLQDGASERSSEPSKRPSADPQEAMLAFTKCMREEGIDVPDPKSGVGMVIDKNSDINPGSAEFQAAEKTCAPLLDEAMAQTREEIDPEEEARMQEAMLEFAQCMRDEGIDFPDPETAANGVTRVGPGSDVDPNDPAVAAASAKCSDRLPGGGVVREEGP